MKTELFKKAIIRRNRIRFIYNLDEIILEPYFVSLNKDGKKVIYGKVNSSNEIKMFEYEKIYNIKVLNSTKFYPIIPIINGN